MPENNKFYTVSFVTQETVYCRVLRVNAEPGDRVYVSSAVSIVGGMGAKIEFDTRISCAQHMPGYLVDKVETYLNDVNLSYETTIAVFEPGTRQDSTTIDHTAKVKDIPRTFEAFLSREGYSFKQTTKGFRWVRNNRAANESVLNALYTMFREYFE